MVYTYRNVLLTALLTICRWTPLRNFSQTPTFPFALRVSVGNKNGLTMTHSQTTAYCGQTSVDDLIHG